MASNGISGKVAVVAMGCSHFGERWDASTDDLILEAYRECVDSVSGLRRDDVDAYWLGTLSSGLGGLTLSRAIGSDDKPVTRVENFCATGSEAFRNACYAAAGATTLSWPLAWKNSRTQGIQGCSDKTHLERHGSGDLDDGTGRVLAARPRLLCASWGASR